MRWSFRTAAVRGLAPASRSRDGTCRTVLESANIPRSLATEAGRQMASAVRVYDLGC